MLNNKKFDGRCIKVKKIKIHVLDWKKDEKTVQ
jgi:hypothetical protein